MTRHPSSILFQERGNRPAEGGCCPVRGTPTTRVGQLWPICQDPGSTWVLGPCAASLEPSIYAEQWCCTRPGLRNALRRQRPRRELDINRWQGCRSRRTLPRFDQDITSLQRRPRTRDGACMGIWGHLAWAGTGRWENEDDGRIKEELNDAEFPVSKKIPLAGIGKWRQGHPVLAMGVAFG